MYNITSSVNEKNLQQNIKTYYHFKRNETAFNPSWVVCVCLVGRSSSDKIKYNFISPGNCQIKIYERIPQQFSHIHNTNRI